jgi:hypothetical protein
MGVGMINYRLPGNADSGAAFGGSYASTRPGNWMARNPLAIRNAFANNYAGIPVGYRERAKIRPVKDGGIAMTVRGAATVTLPLTAYAVADTTMNGAATVTANAFLTSERTAAMLGAGTATFNPAGSRGNIAVTIRVNTLTQDDVTGAVMEAQIEAGLTFRQIVRLLAAVAAGKTDITDLGGGNATVKFRDLGDTKDRITAGMTGSERTSVTRNVT